jgi:PAS domain S-box-containing protein
MTESGHPDYNARRGVLPYTLAVVLPIATLYLQVSLEESFGEHRLLILFMFPIIVSALLGGLWPGLVATVTAAVCAGYFLIPPLQHFAISAGHDLVQWSMLIVNGALVSVMAEFLFRTRSRESARGRQFHEALDRLRVSEVLSQAVYEQTALGIALVAVDGHYLQVNRAVTEMFGYSQAEMLARTWQDLTQPDDLNNDLDLMRRLLTREIATYNCEKRFLASDGRVIWGNLSVAPVWKADGQIDYFIATVDDIQARKQGELTLHAAQDAALVEQRRSRAAALHLLEDAIATRDRAEVANAALRESEGRFRALVEQSLAGIYIIQGGHFSYVNPGFATMFGYGAPEELIDHVAVADLVCPKDRERVLDNLRQRANGVIADMHYIFAGMRRDGSCLDLEVHGRSFTYQGRQAVIGLILDITARKAAEDSLRASELRFHDIVKATADWIWEVDAQGRYTYASESVYNLLGYTPAEVIGKTPFDFMPREEAERVAAVFAEIAARREPFRDLDNVNLRKDGLLIQVDSNGMPILAANGELLGYRGLDRDISERKLAEAALAEREERYRAVVETARDGFWMVDAQGRILAVNDAYARRSGYSREELLGMRTADLEAREQTEDVRAHFQKIMREGNDLFESWHRAKDGGEWPVEVNASHWPEAGGRIFAFLRDISERKTAEAALRDSETRYRSVVNNVKEIIFQTDAQGLWTFLNPAWSEITGFPVEDSLGKLFLDYVHPDDRQRNAELFEPLIQRRKDYCRHEIRYLHQDGGFRWIEVYARLTLDEEDHIIGTSGTLSDITQRRAALDEIRASNEELQRFNRAMIGREMDMIGLKREINELSQRLGLERPYPLAFLDEPAAPVKTA